jgi:hypothetical protein
MIDREAGRCGVIVSKGAPHAGQRAGWHKRCLPSSARLSIAPFPAGRSVLLKRNDVRRSKPPIAAIPGDTKVQTTTILLASLKAPSSSASLIFIIHAASCATTATSAAGEACGLSSSA